VANRQPSGKSGGGWTRTTEREAALDKDDGEGGEVEDVDRSTAPAARAVVHFAPAAIKTESADSGGAKERR
jgi:hypothetical protein